MPVSSKAALLRAALREEEAKAYPLGQGPPAMPLDVSSGVQPAPPPQQPGPAPVPQQPPRGVAQAAALRGPPAAGPTPTPGPVTPPAPVQSGLATGTQGAALNTGLTPADMAIMSGGLPSQERFEQGERSGDLADEMRASSLEPIRGKMVGNIYVPASIAEGGAKIIQAFVARKKEKEQKAERAGARESQAKMLSDWLRDQTGGGGGQTPAAQTIGGV